MVKVVGISFKQEFEKRVEGKEPPVDVYDATSLVDAQSVFESL